MSWQEELLRKELLELYDFDVHDICGLDKYDVSMARGILSILLQWACYGQNEAGIMLGRSEITKIPRDWLKKHMLETVKNSFDYLDDWNYRRLLELVVEVLPENKDDFLALNRGTTNPDLAEVIDDFA